MSALTLQTWLDGIGDPESGRYRILAGLREARSEFNANRLYPTLSDLVGLYRTLRSLLEAGEGLQGRRKIVGLDLNSRQVLFGDAEMSREEMRVLEEMIRWSLPELKALLEEGTTIHNFIEEQTRLQEVGLLPSYVDEGYLMVPDLMRREVHVIRYEMTIFTNAEEKFRNLKTTLVRSLPLESLEASPWSIKQALMRELTDLPNPATYAVESEYRYPFQQTILPIAKRKLLGRICRPS